MIVGIQKSIQITLKSTTLTSTFRPIHPVHENNVVKIKRNFVFRPKRKKLESLGLCGKPKFGFRKHRFHFLFCSFRSIRDYLWFVSESHIGFSDHGKTLYRGKKLYTVRIAQKLSSEQQNHLKEGPGGLCLNLLEYCLTFFEGNLELLTQIA